MKFNITKHCASRYTERIFGGNNISNNLYKTILSDLLSAKNITSKLSVEVPRFILYLKETYGNKGYTILMKEYTVFICLKRKGTENLYDVITCYVISDDFKMFRNTVLKKEEIHLKLKLLKNK